MMTLWKVVNKTIESKICLLLHLKVWKLQAWILKRDQVVTEVSNELKKKRMMKLMKAILYWESQILVPLLEQNLSSASAGNSTIHEGYGFLLLINRYEQLPMGCIPMFICTCIHEHCFFVFRRVGSAYSQIPTFINNKIKCK